MPSADLDRLRLRVNARQVFLDLEASPALRMAKQLELNALKMQLKEAEHAAAEPYPAADR